MRKVTSSVCRPTSLSTRSAPREIMSRAGLLAIVGPPLRTGGIDGTNVHRCVGWIEGDVTVDFAFRSDGTSGCSPAWFVVVSATKQRSDVRTEGADVGMQQVMKRQDTAAD